ncbi:MAG: chromosomal replication initiator protein DnaA [Alphaproteobacteria bacterium]|nr:chromosomal replication initiator protein DnaA [Alphaproteobacteria bacterium]
MIQTEGSNSDVHWARVRGVLRSEFGDAAFRSWLKPIALKDVANGKVVLSVGTNFMRDWIRSHYLDRIQDIWTHEDPSVRSVDVIVLQNPPSIPAESPARPSTNSRGGTMPAEGPTTAEQPVHDGHPTPLDPRLTFENFITGKPNEFAYAAARRVAESPTVPFNPLFLHGGVGLGKTHLMHAIAWHIRKRQPERRVLYLSAEKFMYELIRAIRFKDMMHFKDRFRSVDVLMIDDVQFFAGKDTTQEEFFHTFNALVDQNHQVVVSADKSPSDIEGLEERLRSRMGWGLVADIHPTTYELRVSILQAKAESIGTKIERGVLEFLARRITSNVRELEGALNRVVYHAALVGRDISIETVKEVLSDVLRANDRKVTIEDIQKAVARHFNVRISDMHSARRARAVARPRQVAMFLSKQLTTRSLPEIGRRFGGRDHTTVMHAVKTVERLCAEDVGFAEDVEVIKRSLEG